MRYLVTVLMMGAIVTGAEEPPAAQAPGIVYAWFPRDVGEWDTRAIDWSALTHLCLRTVVLQPDGSIALGWGTTPARIKAVVDEAHSHGVQVTILAWGTDARGSSEYLAKHRDRTVQSLLDFVKTHNLDGVNIDDETWAETNAVTGEPNRPLVTAFFQQLHDAFRAARADYHISYASPAVIDPGDKFGVAWIDYAAVAESIDQFAVMAYTVSSPNAGWAGSQQPVAGGGVVTGHRRDYETVIADYLAATGGRRDKLLLGVATGKGGFEWDCRTGEPLSPIIGKARAITGEQARAHADEHGRRFDPSQQAPWYRYEAGDHWVQGWYEDDQSLAARLALIKKNRIAGACVWVLDGKNEPASTFNLLREHLLPRDTDEDGRD